MSDNIGVESPQPKVISENSEGGLSKPLSPNGSPVGKSQAEGEDPTASSNRQDSMDAGMLNCVVIF